MNAFPLKWLDYFQFQFFCKWNLSGCIAGKLPKVLLTERSALFRQKVKPFALFKVLKSTFLNQTNQSHIRVCFPFGCLLHCIAFSQWLCTAVRALHWFMAGQINTLCHCLLSTEQGQILRNHLGSVGNFFIIFGLQII